MAAPAASRLSDRRGPHRSTAAASSGSTVSSAPSSLVSQAAPNSSPAPAARARACRGSLSWVSLSRASGASTRYPSSTHSSIAVSSSTRSFCRMQNGSSAKSRPLTRPARKVCGPGREQHEHGRGGPGQQRVQCAHLVDPHDHVGRPADQVDPARLQVEERGPVQEERAPQAGEPAMGHAVAQVGVDDLVAEQVEGPGDQCQPDHRGEQAGHDGGPGQGPPARAPRPHLPGRLDGAGRRHPLAPPSEAPDGVSGGK